MDAYSLYKKKWNYSWRRIRKWLKPEQNTEEYQKKIVELCGLLWLEKQGFINVYYGDESRFSMNSYLPSAWQPIGKPIGIVPRRSVGINVFGLLRRDMDFHCYTSDQNINSTLVVAFIDDFVKKIKEPTVIVLDNATTHRSDEFKDNIDRWEENGVYIFHLPTYSPHLNLIETLWRKIKYEWMQQFHFTGSDSFHKGLDSILVSVGSIFNIQFKDQLLPN
jgi:transposase